MQFSLSAGGAPENVKKAIKSQADNIKEANPKASDCLDAIVTAISTELEKFKPTRSISVSVSFYISEA